MAVRLRAASARRGFSDTSGIFKWTARSACVTLRTVSVPHGPLRFQTSTGRLLVNTGRPATSRWLVLVLVCLAQFMVVLDATVVNVALPSIQGDLDFSSSSLQWVVNGYTLVFGGFLLLGGRTADLLGRKRLFIAG